MVAPTSVEDDMFLVCPSIIIELALISRTASNQGFAG
jgi:hypothetical protein